MAPSFKKLVVRGGEKQYKTNKQKEKLMLMNAGQTVATEKGREAEEPKKNWAAVKDTDGKKFKSFWNRSDSNNEMGPCLDENMLISSGVEVFHKCFCNVYLYDGWLGRVLNSYQARLENLQVWIGGASV